MYYNNTYEWKGANSVTDDRALVGAKLDRWQRYMEHYRLPSWEELPDMELYIDQVVSLVGRYLDLIPHDEKNPIVTASIINNYVRLKVVPAPEKKRYSRRHLAYVLMVCVLKQCLSLTEIQKILPQDMESDQTRGIYNEFASRVTETSGLFTHQVRKVAERELVEGNAQGCNSLVLHSAISSVLYKLLTQKLAALQPENPPETE